MKKILMLLAFAGVTAVASAQQVTVTQTEVIEVQDRYQVLTNPFWSNWFFSVGGGAQVLYGNGDNAGKFKDRISPVLNVAIGKWFTPGLGLRLQYSGLEAKGFTYDKGALYVTGNEMGDGYYKQKFDYMNLHGDIMFNLNALFGGYNSHRVYEIIPYLGAGFTHSFTKPHVKAFTMNAGLINRFRVSSAVDINLELSATGLEGKFDGEHGGKHDYDGILGASIGLTYHFPQRGFQRPYPQMISELELRNMRQQMNEMAAANLELQQQLMDAESQPTTEVVEQQTVVVDADIIPRTVFFNIGSAEITPREAMNLSYLADHMKKFPNTSYVVNGYADSATGTPGLNKELSMKRAQAIVNVLVKQYGISANRLTVDANGGVDKFGQPILNRVVLVESNK
ncbi:OmpA family protein [Oscillospiraceae bacterium N12]|jgi:outer membrane protein OmpA-like peptidoglycan-associated protein|uniref:OmpA family protein n=1 Tax=Jilunia laotingensis TaxID=2763675 RepID=A0A926F6Y3_9BACT|nr:OmpA family protein [Jilunia laotingensis]MBC8593182.1 OmpA family protein [Jilunia laotingensis]